MITGKRNIKSGEEFNHLFPKPEGDYVSIKKEAVLRDTIGLMQQVIDDTLDDTKLIAKKLQGASVLLTCKRIWNFCFSHLQYEKDEERKEQVRRPARSWHDRKRGVDCDCLTVFIGSILTNLQIPFLMRMTRYKGLEFEHIYPVAESPEGEIIIDCVVHEFNYEVPYTEKKDVKMELQYLNGVTGERFNEFGDKVRFVHDLPIDAEDLFRDEIEFQGLGASAKKEARQEKRAEKKEERKANPGQVKEKLKEGLKKGVNAVNKVNPATALLRAGILASMKLNLFQVASTLRFAYWTEADAQKNEMDLAKFKQLQAVRVKLEKIYFTAGGNTNALKESILTGKGNQDKMVQLNGLGEVIPMVTDNDDLRTILGDQIFYQELNGFDGLHGLGNLGSAIAAGAAVTAASGVIATISGVLKKIGGVFKKGSNAAQKIQIKANTDIAEEKTRKFSVKNLVNKVKSKIQERKENKLLNQGEASFDEDATEDTTASYEENFPTDEFSEDGAAQNRSAEDSDAGGEKKGVIQWVKDNPVPSTIIGLVVVGGAILGIRAYNKSKNKSKKGLDGLPKSKKHKSKKHKPAVKQNPKKKKSYSTQKIELL
jgi:hypothetical protein